MSAGSGTRTEAAHDERVVVAMSGGVDSSVAAAMLVEEGADAIGVTMKLSESESRCCSLEDADDARRVAERLGIRFYVANYADAFTKEVVEPFADVARRHGEFVEIRQQAVVFGLQNKFAVFHD